MVPITMSVDAVTKERISELPKRMSASRVLRYVITAMFTNDEEFAEYIKTPEGKEVRAFVREKVGRRL